VKEQQAEGTGAIVSVVQAMTDRGNVIAEANSRQFDVRETNPHTDRRWESFVMQHPAATIYHHPSWLAALEREYKQRSVYLICEDEVGQLHGLFPLMYTRGLPLSKGRPLAGARLASLPRTPLAGPLASDPRATTLLLQEAVRRIAAAPNFRLQIKLQERELGGLVDGVVEKPWRFTYLLRLQETPGEPIRFSNSKHRTTMKGSIGRALANGLRPRLAETEDDLKGWYRAYLESMRRNVVPARPYRFFRALWQSMGSNGLMRVWLVEHHTGAGATIVGGHIYFKLGKTLSYAFNGALTSALPLRPNDILLWQAIHDAQNEGCRVVDFGEVPDGDDSLAQYKLKWGAQPVRLYRYYYPDFQDVEHSSEKKESNLVGMAKAVWRHLPLGVTSWIGDRIYSRL
jgi:CelD/BcsL family acetyltransferase involved in cellulose biosynthesis